MRSTKALIILTSLAIATGALITGCKKPSGCTDSNATNYDPSAQKNDGSCMYGDKYASMKQEIKANYAQMAFAGFDDAYQTAVELQTTVNAFIANPTASGFEACKKAWKAAREPYGQTEAFRFANGPIDDENGPEGLINSWPLDENYIDYISGESEAGIINNPATYPTINTDLLVSMNENGGETNIASGYHAIEFLLWGQDDPNTALKTPGQRPYTDYLTTNGTADHQERRQQYLKAATDLLVQDLKKVRDAWDPNGGNNYRTTFLAMDNDKALQNMLTGIGTLSKSELAGERIFVALDNQDQEDEQSCFSDNTHRDIIQDAQGIRNVYTGSYTRVDGSIVSGTSIQQLLATVDATVADSMNNISSESMTRVNAIPVPFDYALTQETVGGNGPIMQSVNILRKQGDEIAAVAKALGLSINTALPQ